LNLHIKPSTKQLLRYLAVGALNSAWGYALFSAFIFFKAHYSIALFLATLLGILFNFFTYGKLVFSSVTRHNFIKFIAGYGLVYVLNLGLLASLKPFLSAYVAQALCMPIAIITTYGINKYWVYKN